MTEKTALATHVAKVHPAGILADLVTLQEYHRLTTLAQEKRRGSAHQAAPDNQYIGLLRDHDDTSSVSIERGLTGA